MSFHNSEHLLVSLKRNKSTRIFEHQRSNTGTDVKVYTVGPQYAHAEARKAPTLDGIVVRSVCVLSLSR